MIMMIGPVAKKADLKAKQRLQLVADGPAPS